MVVVVVVLALLEIHFGVSIKLLLERGREGVFGESRGSGASIAVRIDLSQ